VIAPPAATSAPLSLAAIRLGQGLSGLLAADGQRLVLAALPRAQQVLTAHMTLPALVPASATAATAAAASTPATQTSTPATQTAAPALAARISTATDTAEAVSVSTWLTLGAAPRLTTFDDPLLTPQLDPRWTYLSSPGADARAAPGGIAFAPVSTPTRTLLLQGAPGRDVAIDVQVTMPAGASATARAGLVFYLDDANLITLSVDRAGHISFCPTIGGQALTCQRTQLSAHPSAGAPILLRLSQLGDVYSGYASLDGNQWTQVGAWHLAADTPSSPQQSGNQSGGQAGAGSAASAQATTLQGPRTPSLLFTGIGIFAQDSAAPSVSADPAAWPRVAGFAASIGIAPAQS